MAQDYWKGLKTNFNRLKPPLLPYVVRNIKLWYTFLSKAMFLYAGTTQKSDQHENEADN